MHFSKWRLFCTQSAFCSVSTQLNSKFVFLWCQLATPPTLQLAPIGHQPYGSRSFRLFKSSDALRVAISRLCSEQVCRQTLASSTMAIGELLRLRSSLEFNQLDAVRWRQTSFPSVRIEPTRNQPGGQFSGKDH